MLVGGPFAEAYEIKPLIWLSWMFLAVGGILVALFMFQARKEVQEARQK